VTRASPREGLDPRIVKAISHPLRYQVLARINDAEASPVEIARELDEPVGRVSHHVQALLEVGAIELVRTEPRRGAVEHFYRAAVPAWFSDEDWARLPVSVRDAISAQNLRLVLDDLAAAAPGRAFGHPSAYLARLVMDLDDQAIEEISALLTEMVERAAAIEAAAAERGAVDRPTELVLLHFERASEDSGPRSRS